LRLAEEQEKDLVEISPNAVPPVCRIVDYKKFLYDQKKRQKEIKAKQTNVETKEIRFGPNTDDHDFQFKLKHAVNFLQEGAKVKAHVFFKGRAIVFKERGEVLLLKFIQELSEYGIPEAMPKLEGKKMFVLINPKKK
jgi:translation initiation factor IF-3